MRSSTRVHLVLGICLVLSLASISARGAQDVEATPQAKAYRAALKAIAAGDYEAYRKTLSSAALKQMDEQTKGKSPKEKMEFAKMMSPTEVKLTSVKVEGKNATLLASAKMDGQAMKGSIALQKEGGQWKVGQPSWEPAK
jgi:collagenase-like PrtC family protease